MWEAKSKLFNGDKNEKENYSNIFDSDFYNNGMLYYRICFI